MGLKDLFSAAVDSVKEGDITDLMQGGLIGNKIMRDQKMAVQQAESRQKPGKLCDSQCPVNDMRCEACLKQQKEIISGLEGLTTLETAIISLQGRIIEMPSGCSNCGAPIEKGKKNCSYCGAAYQLEVYLANLPKTEFERDKLLLDRTTEVFAGYTKLYKKQVEYKKENVKLPGIMKGFTNMIAANIEKGMDMNSAMIRQGANDNGVSYPTYISGVMTGQYQSVAMINLQNQLQQQSQMLAESRRQQQEYNERSRQIEMERQAKLKATRDENAALRREMAKTRVPRYGSGVPEGTCCGNCRYYMVHDNKCAYNERRYITGANDYCNNHVNK